MGLPVDSFYTVWPTAVRIIVGFADAGLNVRLGKHSHACVRMAREVICAVTRRQYNGCGEQGATAAKRRLTIDIHHNQDDRRVVSAVQLSVCDRQSLTERRRRKRDHRQQI